MDDYLDDALRPLLETAGLASFEALWGLEADWFEPPNRRRGGWSGVVRIELPDADGRLHGLFLKRQENHTRRSLAHPFRGEPTFAAEMRNILGLQRAAVPTLQPVFYAQRKVKGRWRALLLTRELQGFRPLDTWVDEWLAAGWGETRIVRRRVLAAIAPPIRRMHLAGRVHNALHPKHVFLRVGGQGEVAACLIDLEKMRRRLPTFRAALRDLDSLNRRSRYWSRSDRLRFLKHYLGTDPLDWRGRLLWRQLASRQAASAGGPDRA